LGDTSKAHKAGEFTDFFLMGSDGIFAGFSTEFAGRAWDLDENVVKTLVGNQSGNGIVKLDGSFKMPEPKKEQREGMALNCEEAPLDVEIEKGGRVVMLNTQNLPLVGEVGLEADLVRLDGDAMCSPGFSCDLGFQVTYIVRGSGTVHVVGVDGRRVLETTAREGNLFIVPRFFVVSKIASPDGLEWFSILSPPPSRIFSTFLISSIIMFFLAFDRAYCLPDLVAEASDGFFIKNLAVEAVFNSFILHCVLLSPAIRLLYNLIGYFNCMTII
jgi:hypothetical protein